MNLNTLIQKFKANPKFFFPGITQEMLEKIRRNHPDALISYKFWDFEGLSLCRRGTQLFCKDYWENQQGMYAY